MKETASCIDVIKTVNQYVITNTFKTQFKNQQSEGKAILIFLIDSSSSMLKDQQIAFIKGMIEKTVERFHRKHVHYAVVALQQSDATLVTGLTKNANNVLTGIEKLTTGGKTNMKAGFRLLHQLLKHTMHKDCNLHIFTDGRINAGDTASPFSEAVTYYKTFLKRIQDVHVVDNETGFVKLGRARELAKEIGAYYSDRACEQSKSR